MVDGIVKGELNDPGATIVGSASKHKVGFNLMQS